MFNKIVNSKITWIVLIGIVLILFVILIIPKKDNNDTRDKTEESLIIDDDLSENIVFELVGSEVIDIYVNDEYEDDGFIALLNNDDDISDYVSVDDKLDNSKVGKYEISYFLDYKGINKKITRIINVNDHDKNEISLKLNGDETIFLNLNEEYEEQGIVASYNNEDLSNYVEIEKNIDNTKVGNYEVIYKVKYNNVETEIKREVVVFDLDSMFNVNKDNMTINIMLNNNFKYVKLPNGVVNTSEVITYKVLGAGNYEFVLYTSNLKKYSKLITITESNSNSVTPEIPKTLTGTCEAILKDGKTTVTVNSSSDIAKYKYNGVESSSSIYNVNKYLRDSYVELIDKTGNTTKINCKITMESLPVIEPQSGEKVKYQNESETLKIFISEKSGFYITRVWAKDPVYQLRKQFATGSLQRTDTILSKAVSENNLKDKIVVGFNASPPISKSSYYAPLAKSDSRYDLTEPSPLVIYNGKVIINDYKRTSLNEIIYYINSNNQLTYSPKFAKGTTAEERKVKFQEVIDDGAYNTMIWAPVMVENYKTKKLTASEIGNSDYSASRSGLCQIDTNNFIIFSSKSATKKRQEFANFVGKFGCRIAVNFDGGGSVSFLYKKPGTTKVQTLSNGGEDRKLSAVMYFTELQ